MERTLLTTLLCLLGSLVALAQPKHYPADYKSPTTPDGPIVVAYVTSNATCSAACTGSTPATTLRARCAPS